MELAISTRSSVKSAFLARIFIPFKRREFTKSFTVFTDFKMLLSSANHHCGSAAAAAQIANHTSWRRLWDIALDRGVKGTRTMQAIFRELCRPLSCFQCSLCEAEVPTYSSCLKHACRSHPDKIENLSYTHLISLLIEADSADSIFSSCKHVSYSSKLWTFKHYLPILCIPSGSLLLLLYQAVFSPSYAAWVRG